MKVTMPTPVAYLTEHEDYPRLWLDRQEARTYCDEGEEPVPLFTLAGVWRLAMEQAVQRINRMKCDVLTDWAEGYNTACDDAASAIRSLPMPAAANTEEKNG